MAYLPVSKSNSKWLLIIASTYIQSTSGSSYCFSLYSPLLKRSQSYSQSTLDLVAVFKDIGTNVGVLSGVLYSYLGLRSVLAVDAVQCFIGYLFIWMCVVEILPRQPVWVFMQIAAHAQTFFNTAVLFMVFDLLNSMFEGRVVAKLPFQHVGFVRKMRHRGLVGDDAADCSMATCSQDGIQIR